LIRLVPRELPAARPKDEELFFKVTRAAFGQRRKTILNALSGSPTLGLSKARAGDALRGAAIDETCRGETLGITELARLADAIAAGDV
jgi:16S rRNA (adenine1518-N6/adenine1519-N6)-dimethyltransferase